MGWSHSGADGGIMWDGGGIWDAGDGGVLVFVGMAVVMMMAGTDRVKDGGR